jgi:outer membrane protein OmpA-like peptidoglycan-associated protein
LIWANTDGHTDYLPRYRKMPEQFIITKVEYQQAGKTILFFRFVAVRDKENVHFFGQKHQNAWQIWAASNVKGMMSRLRQCEVKNIRLNDVLQTKEVSPLNTFGIELQRGDIVSCEISFERLPEHIKNFDLTGGEKNKNNEDRFACHDFVVKDAQHPNLGNKEQMDIIIERFYKDCKNVRYPDIKEVTSLDQEQKFQERKEEMKATKTDAPVSASMKSDYMPKILGNDVEDIECQERYILANIYFEDNSADLVRRNLALKTINLILEYLRRYPHAKIMLHGHTDIHGDAYRNLILSKDRILTIKSLFTDRGIQSNRIITLYYGGTQPLPLYKEGGNMNRRVELEIICNEQPSPKQQEYGQAPSASGNAKPSPKAKAPVQEEKGPQVIIRPNRKRKSS